MRKKRNVMVGLLAVLLAMICGKPGMAADEPFIWEDWIAFYSLSANNQQGYLKVAFGRRGKSATVYARILNGTNLRIRGSVNFDLVDGNTGKVKTGQNAPFGELKPGAVDQSLGNWFMIPDRTISADSFTVRNIRLKDLWLPLPSDPNGSLYEYYPNNMIAAEEQRRNNAAAEKQRREDEAAAAERKRQDEAAQQQRDAAAAEQKRQADADRQERDAQQQRQADAAQKQREDQQQRKQEEAEHARRENQRVIDNINRQAQAVADQANRNIQGIQNTYNAQQDSKAEYERRSRAIEDRYVNAGDDVDYSEVRFNLGQAEEYARLKRNAEAEVRNYQNQAAYQTGAARGVSLAAAALSQSQVNKYARKEENYRDEAKRLERKANQDAQKRRAEREAEKQQELDNLRQQAANNDWGNNTAGASQQPLGGNMMPSNNLPARETPRVYVPPTPEQMKANQNLLTSWMAMSGDADISKDAVAWPAISQALLQGATDFNLKNVKNGATLLHYAAANNDTAAVEYLLDHGMNADIEDKLKQIPIEYAARNNQEEMVTLFLRKGATSEQMMRRALIAASFKNADKVAAMLLAQGASPSAWWNMSPLIAAAYGNADKVIPLLLARGANGNGALSAAVRSKSNKALEILLAAGMDVNEVSQDGNLPIIDAVRENPDIIEKLIAAGANVNKKDISQQAALYHVEDKNAEKVIPLLLAAGADVNIQMPTRPYDDDKPTPLYDAVRRGKEKVVEQLIKAKEINPNIQCYHGKTPLLLAVEDGREKIVEQLLKAKGIDLNVRDDEGNTPLHYASGYSQVKDRTILNNIVRMLLAAGADPNIQGEGGRTPLHLAAKWGTDETIEMLLKAGAKRNIKDKYKNTANYYLKERKKNK